MIPKMTNTGREVMIHALDGQHTVKFTRFGIGNGACPDNYATIISLVNEVASVGIAEIEIQSEYATLTGTYTNQNLENAFSWTEVGLFCEDPEDSTKEVLYAYGHYVLDEKSSPEAYIPAKGAEAIELQLVYSIYIGPLENVVAVITQSAGVSKAEFEAHLNDFDNPHRVTKEQIGLGNVEDVAPNNQTITYQTTTVVAELKSGETISSAFKKIAAAIKSLITHIQDNLSHVSPADRQKWNSKADAIHSHKASDITSGVLAVARGGTGVASYGALQTELKVHGAYIESTLSATLWNATAKTYSLATTYPSDKYNLEVALAPSATTLQMAAFASAAILGSATGNTLTAKGRVPNIDIPVIIKYREVL